MVIYHDLPEGQREHRFEQSIGFSSNMIYVMHPCGLTLFSQVLTVPFARSDLNFCACLPRIEPLITQNSTRAYEVSIVGGFFKHVRLATASKLTNHHPCSVKYFVGFSGIQ